MDLQELRNLLNMVVYDHRTHGKLLDDTFSQVKEFLNSMSECERQPVSNNEQGGNSITILRQCSECGKSHMLDGCPDCADDKNAV